MRATYDYTYYRPRHKRYSYMTGNDVEYTYGTSGNETGQLTEIQDGSGIQLFSYDALGNVSQNIRTFAVPNSNNTYTFTMDFVYDSWGRVLEMTYPDGERVEYGYNLGGDLLSMTGHKGLDIYNYIEDIRYDLFGNRTGIEYGNDTRSEYSYDDLQRLTRLKTYAMNGNNEVLIQDIAYTFDNVGNITDAANSATAFGTLGGVYSNHYVYDGIDRLTRATQSYGTGNVLDASYSPSGRLCGKSQTFTGQDVLFGYLDDDRPHAPRVVYSQDNLYNLIWDGSGNLSQVGTYKDEGEFLSARYLYWTEDNRLTNVVDDEHFSYYTYDHSGERVLKLSGGNSQLDVNADEVNYFSIVENVTLYTSPYLVASERGYTKHYYAGAERVCARTGNGNLNRLNDFIGHNSTITNNANDLFDACILEMETRELQEDDLSDISYLCGKEPIDELPGLELSPMSVIVDTKLTSDDFAAAMSLYSNLTQQSEEPFFYHADHLGSASWITDVHGVPVQHLQYLPYGERFVDQHTSGYEERYTFTGKEKDSETGFCYFGARYYDCDLSGLFLSVDPMADKYPNLSPYAYCAWNPVKLVDPDGRDLYIPNEDSESHNASKQDILSLVKDKYKKYICFDKEGNVSLSEDVTDGMLKNDKGLALIKDLVTSQKKFLYEASDDASSTYNDGLSHEMTSDEWTMDGIVNASSYGKDSRGLYTHTPKEGYDGHVILAKSGDWKETDKNGFATSIRKSVLFHELAENYYRTNNNMDYNEAHNKAVAREGFVFNRNFPGTIPRMSRSNPKDGFYYKGEHIF